MNLKVMIVLSTMATIVLSGSEKDKKIAARSFNPHVDPTSDGVWRKKYVWKPRWVKTWQEKKVFIAVWKKMWGPVEVKEWIPIPKPPPGWLKQAKGNWGFKKIPIDKHLTFHKV